MAAQTEATPYVAYNKIDGKVPTLIGNWVEVRNRQFRVRSGEHWPVVRCVVRS